MKNEDLNAIVGRNLSRLRKTAGMTQAQLSERVGISAAFLSRVPFPFCCLRQYSVPAAGGNTILHCRTESFHYRMEFKTIIRFSKTHEKVYDKPNIEKHLGVLRGLLFRLYGCVL